MNILELLKTASPSWHAELSLRLKAEDFDRVSRNLDSENSEKIWPRAENIFRAFAATPPEKVRVVLLGQDPYPTPGNAHGLSFSVPHGAKIPMSLRNMYAEMVAESGGRVPTHGNLEHWAEQGVLLLNTILTVREREPLSHVNFGWQKLTSAAIQACAELPQPVAYLILGKKAEEFLGGIEPSAVTGPRGVIVTAHPSPMSVTKFRGSRPFGRVNEFLRLNGEAEILWQRE